MAINGLRHGDRRLLEKLSPYGYRTVRKYWNGEHVADETKADLDQIVKQLIATRAAQLKQRMEAA